MSKIIRPKLLIILSSLFILCLVNPGLKAAAQFDLNVPLVVRENASVGATAYPINAVIPLPRGQHTNPATLGIRNRPSQVEVLERWPDNSLRHVMVHFQPTVNADSDVTYYLTDDGQTRPDMAVTVTQNSNRVEVNTGPLRFRVSKNAFNIFDELWLDENGNGNFENSERIIASNNRNGGVFVPRNGAGSTQYDTARSDLTVEIEERGPMRAVIRIEAPTLYRSTTDHQHGFAVRIYAYAGKPYVKVDYQLQNSAKVVRSWPLYFESLNLDFRLNLAANPTVTFGTIDGQTRQTTAPAYLAQERHNRYAIYNGQRQIHTGTNLAYTDINDGIGFVDVSDSQHGVTAMVRNFWQMWPNGLALDNQNKLSLQLYPEWSAQWRNTSDDAASGLSNTGLYWLKDMQHVYKESLLFFHGTKPTDSSLQNLAKTFQFHPVASPSTDWYRQTEATLDLGGVVPPASVIPSSSESHQPDRYWNTNFYDANNRSYAASARNFGIPSPSYRAKPCTTGGWPYGTGNFVATGNSSDYFFGETWAIGELNVRPQWMAQYKHIEQQRTLQLTENPYCGGTWRLFEGHGSPTLATDPLPGIANFAPNYGARDDQHGWFYHVAESYFYTGNLWVKDWYKFVAEFRRTRLAGLDPFRDRSSRATGHALNHALQAYRVTGDTALLDEFRNYLRTYLIPEQDPLYGDQAKTAERSGGGFQTGYLMRAIVDYMEEVRGKDAQAYAEAFNYLSGLMAWNLHHGNFPYYFNTNDGGEGQSSGTGLTLLDPQAWYYWHTGKQAYWQQIEDYLDGGINGGRAPFGNFTDWQGQFEGRYYLFVKNSQQRDQTPPSAIRDLTATQINNNQVNLQWTAPNGANRYHIVWSNKPIVEAHSTRTDVSNWWAANAVGPNLVVAPGQRQGVTIDVDRNSPIYAAIFTFDQTENMSAMSNVAQARSGNGTPVPTATATPLAPSTPSVTPTRTPIQTPVQTPSGNIRHLRPGNSFEAAVESLNPGDTLLVHAGDYSDSGRISIQARGSAGSPITIMGAPGEARPRILRPANANAQNTINIEGSSYLTIQGLEIMGNGGDGIRLYHAENRHITLEDLVIHGVQVGINAQQNVDQLTIRRNQIYNTAINGATGTSTGGTGEGMYLGCHDGSCVVSNSLIVNNWVHDTQAGSQGDGIEIKRGSYGNIVRDNVIYNTKYPCILLYGTNGNRANLVEGNVVWNCDTSGIQAAADSIIQNNIILNSGIGFNSHSHNGVQPQNLRFVHNTIVNADTCLNIRDWNNRSSLVFANNAIYCDSDSFDIRGGLNNVNAVGNVIYPRAAALPNNSYRVGRSVAQDFVNANNLNLYPSSNSALLDAGHSGQRATTDFNGTQRSGIPDAGAYTRTEARNPGWPVQSGFKATLTDTKALLYFSSSTGGRAGNVGFADEDIMAFDRDSKNWERYFDGSDVGLRKWDVDAFHILDDGNILFSLDRPRTIKGVRYDDSDIIKFTATSLGRRTRGSFSMYLDGSDVQLTKGAEDIDAIALLDNGDLVISTLGTARVRGVVARDEDLLRFHKTQLGNDTAGTWSLYFDGSDVKLSHKNEDIWAVWVDEELGQTQLSTYRNYNAGGLKGDGDDILACDGSVGSDTRCKLSLAWDGDAYGFGRELIDGYSVGPPPMFTVFSADRDDNEDAEDEMVEVDDESVDILDDDEYIHSFYLPLISR